MPKDNTPPPWSALAFVALILLMYGGIYLASLNDIEKAEVGDCVAVDPSDADSPYSIVDCGAGSARLKVLQRLPDINADECMTVAGASRSVSIISDDDNIEICMGGKDIDPAKAVNVAQEGECLELFGDDAQRLPCSQSAAKYKILKRLTNVQKHLVPFACEEIPNTTSTYSWSWEPSGSGPQIVPLTAAVVFCLTPNGM
ncbi:MAG: hypothetical protein M3Q75_03645 [Gemmatimonadota bacterium]|nr:hypothetical protein [Gemmatimonadota bacterium]